MVEPITGYVLAHVQQIDARCAPSDSAHQVAMRLDYCLGDLLLLASQPPDQRAIDHASQVRAALLATAAEACRGLRDLRIERPADAHAKDIPF